MVGFLAGVFFGIVMVVWTSNTVIVHGSKGNIQTVNWHNKVYELVLLDPKK